MTTDSDQSLTFAELGLPAPLLQALSEVGYESPSPIQAQTIPLLLKKHDLIGQAQTGTGKTAAFALPMLSQIDLDQRSPQLLVLAPTRELAIQISEAFQRYAHHMKGFHVLPIYGGQSYDVQLRQLKRGVHVVVGTPGRVMDHMRRGTLNLSKLKALVLDEADEMLRMGFIDDVEWILDQTPENHQIALFSATMPPQIRKIADKYLKAPEHVVIKVKTTTAETIRQRYLTVSARQKMDALTRILEVEPFDGLIIFVRTKTATEEIADKLEARGFTAAALNGDISQKQREMTVNRLKKGHIDIIVATDVAARGLDVERISHVINYDIPQDTEPYVHRIGRTGRAGRKGDAILFVTPREKRMLYAIERATKQRIDQFEMPSTAAINDSRIEAFKQRISEILDAGESLELFSDIVTQYCSEHNVPASEVAAALAKLVQGDKPLLLKDEPKKAAHERQERNPRFDAPEDKRRSTRHVKSAADELLDDERDERRLSRVPKPEKGMERYRIEVGRAHGVKTGNVVGAIANELGLESEFIHHVTIMDQYSTVDLPEGMPRELQRQFRRIRVAGRTLDAAVFGEEASPSKGAKRAHQRPMRGKKGRPTGHRVHDKSGRKPQRKKKR